MDGTFLSRDEAALRFAVCLATPRTLAEGETALTRAEIAQEAFALADAFMAVRTWA